MNASRSKLNGKRDDEERKNENSWTYITFIRSYFHCEHAPEQWNQRKPKMQKNLNRKFYSKNFIPSSVDCLPSITLSLLFLVGSVLLIHFGRWWPEIRFDWRHWIDNFLLLFRLLSVRRHQCVNNSQNCFVNFFLFTFFFPFVTWRFFFPFHSIDLICLY